MTQQTIVQMADDILGGILTDPGKLKSKSHLQENQEELPEVSPAQHDIIMSHILDEGVKDTAERVMKKVKHSTKVASHRAKAYVTGKAGPYSWKNASKKPGKHGAPALPRTLGGDIKKVRNKISGMLKPMSDKDFDAAGMPRRGERYLGPRELQRKDIKKNEHKMENFTQDQIETLKKAKEIVSEMTGVGSIGVNMSGGDESSHHPALQVKLPGDKDQAKQIKAASTPPAIQLKAIKGQSPKGHYVNNKAGVKRKSSSSKDDETQRRVHDDMSAMYHESFDSFVDGILLKEDATGKRYKGDVSVAEFGRKGPANDTFGGGGIQTGGRGPVVKLTKNQLMTAKKKSAGSGQDKGENGFGKASSHSRKHPQNPYAGGK